MIYNLQSTIIYLIRFFLAIFIIFIPMKTSIYPISFGLLVLFFISYIVLNQKFALINSILQEQKKPIVAFSCVVISMIVSNALSDYTTLDSWRIVAHYIFRYFLFFIILLVLYKDGCISKRFIVITLLCSLFLQNIDGIYQAITGFDFIRGYAGSLYAQEGIAPGLKGATFNRNTFGFFMALGVSFCTIFLLKRDLKLSKIQYLFFMLTLFLFLFNLLFSYSRSAWVFYIVFLTFFIILENRYLTKKTLLTLIIIIMLIIAFFTYFDALLMRLFQLVHFQASNRDKIWLDTIALIKNNILFGYGVMTYEKLASQNIASVHNSILEILLYLGINGFVAFTYLLYTIWEQIVKIKNSIYYTFFFAILIITQFDHSIIKSIPMLSSLSIFAFFIFSDTSYKIKALSK